MAGEIVLFFLPYLLVPFALIPFHRARLRSIDFDMQSLEFEADLLQYDASNGERRAEKILRINDIQLRRYYDLNLSQNLWIFGLGAFCILLGTAIIGVAMCVVLKAPRESKLMVAVLGGIGSILANFIAAIYLHMNAAATTNLATFHSKLVETQKLFMANLLVSRIDPDEMRWETLSQLALRIMAEPENQTIK
ncbi:MAG: hypothetical protein QOF89_4796 [Acidobacteriota bacterium]|nr:hypothetical protein [Acidobacteriota bacterium]